MVPNGPHFFGERTRSRVLRPSGSDLRYLAAMLWSGNNQRARCPLAPQVRAGLALDGCATKRWKNGFTFGRD